MNIADDRWTTDGDSLAGRGRQDRSSPGPFGVAWIPAPVLTRMFCRSDAKGSSNEAFARSSGYRRESIHMIKKFATWLKQLLESECPLVSNDQFDRWGN